MIPIAEFDDANGKAVSRPSPAARADDIQRALNPDDQGEAHPADAPPSIAPRDDDPSIWLAVWRPSSRTAFTVDVHADELTPYERSLRSAGNIVAGPFNTKRGATDFAVEKLATAQRLNASRRRRLTPAAAP